MDGREDSSRQEGVGGMLGRAMVENRDIVRNKSLELRKLQWVGFISCSSHLRINHNVHRIKTLRIMASYHIV